MSSNHGFVHTRTASGGFVSFFPDPEPQDPAGVLKKKVKEAVKKQYEDNSPVYKKRQRRNGK